MNLVTNNISIKLKRIQLGDSNKSSFADYHTKMEGVMEWMFILTEIEAKISLNDVCNVRNKTMIPISKLYKNE